MAAMALSPWWLFNTALGNSEGLLAAAVLWAVIAHLSGHTRAALACATAAALMRPEAWPFLGLYGVWLWRRDEDRRAVIAAAAIVPLLWFGPDLLGAGGALGASHTARGVPSPGSAKLESVPFLAVLGDTATISTLPAVVGALLAAFLGGPLTRRIFIAAGRLGGDRGGDDGRGLRRQPALPRRGRALGAALAEPEPTRARAATGGRGAGARASAARAGAGRRGARARRGRPPHDRRHAPRPVDPSSARAPRPPTRSIP